MNNTSLIQSSTETSTPAFKPLPEIFESKGFVYRMISRDENGIAVFEQLKVMAYEVVKIIKRPQVTIYEKTYEPQEVMPSSEQWGTKGFTAKSLVEVDKFKKLLLGVNSDDSIGDIEVEVEDDNNDSCEEGEYKFPEGEFSTKDFAEFNGVDYNEAAVFFRNNPTMVKFSREERRNAKGKMTKLFKKI